MEFFSRHTVDVARELLGCTLRAPGLSLRIVETEAYRADDSACHASRGRTARNTPMWGPPGRLYVYLCYGVHWMLNVVTEAEGAPAAVLIRGCSVSGGADLVRARRGGRDDLNGPGKVGQALALDRSFSGEALGVRLDLFAGVAPSQILAGPRVGIGYADPLDQARPWRFRAAD